MRDFSVYLESHAATYNMCWFSCMQLGTYYNDGSHSSLYNIVIVWNIINVQHFPAVFCQYCDYINVLLKISRAIVCSINPQGKRLLSGLFK